VLWTKSCSAGVAAAAKVKPRIWGVLAVRVRPAVQAAEANMLPGADIGIAGVTGGAQGHIQVVECEHGFLLGQLVTAISIKYLQTAGSIGLGGQHWLGWAA
jgi:hypothetical protein